jgi:hypothetical protein
MLKGNIALFLRLVLFSIAALIAALPFATFDQATGVLSVDLGGASKFIVASIWTSIGGGTFIWSRVAKRIGGVT